jgi:hypothetical protein
MDMRVLDDKREMLPTAVVAGGVADSLAPGLEVVACEVGADTALTRTVTCDEVDPITLELVEICMT